MKEKLKIVILALIIVECAMTAAFFTGWRYRAFYDEKTSIKHDTIVLRHTDTIKLPAPPPDTVTKTEYKTVLVPLNDVEVDTDVDSARVTLPFEQHHAQLEDVADVWYSGYDAKIDSAIVYKHSQTVIEQHYITPSAKHNIIAVEAGTKDASIMYMRQFGSFYVGISAGTTYEGTATAKGIVGFRF